MNLGHIGIEHSLKRIAWAYGCSKKGSDEEERLRRLLLRKVGQVHVERQLDGARRDGPEDAS